MKENFKNSIIEAIIPITIITLIILTTIVLIRLIFYILIFILSKFYRKEVVKKDSKKQNTDITIYKKEEDQRYRNQKLEKKQEKIDFKFQGVEKMNDISQQEEHLENDGKIVDIVKPIGFWTSLVLGDQLSQILERAQVLNNRSHKGFWVSMLEAKARGHSREQERGRGL